MYHQQVGKLTKGTRNFNSVYGTTRSNSALNGSTINVYSNAEIGHPSRMDLHTKNVW